MNNKIDQLLQKREVTSYRLSKLTGVNESVINKIRKGKSKDFTISTAYKIAKALGVKIDDLIDEED